MEKGVSVKPIIVLLLLTVPVQAQQLFVNHGRNERFNPPTFPPASATWKLFALDGSSIEARLQGIQPSLEVTGLLAYVVTESNAVDFGLNWPAWEKGINDPKYYLSTIEFAGQVKQTVTPFRTKPGVPFDLDYIAITISGYHVFDPFEVAVSPIAVGHQIPEPKTLTVVVGLAGCWLAFVCYNHRALNKP